MIAPGIRFRHDPNGWLRELRAVGAASVWAVGGASVARILGLFASIAVARPLGAANFGAYMLIVSTVGTISGLAGGGLGMTITKHVSELRASRPDQAGRIVALIISLAVLSGVVMGTALFVTASWVAASVLSSGQLVSSLRIASLAMVFSVLSAAQLAILNGLERFDLGALSAVVGAVIFVPLSVLGARYGGIQGTVWGFVGSLLLTSALNTVLTGRALSSRGLRLRFRGAWVERRVLVSFSLPAIMSYLLFAPVDWAVNVLLARQPSGTQQVAFLSIGRQWHQAVVFLPQGLSSVTFPRLASAVGAGDDARFRRLIRVNSLVMVILSLVPSIVLVLLSGRIMATYGPGFSGGTSTLRLMALYGFLYGSIIVAGQAIWALGRAKLGFILSLVRGAAVLSFSTLFIGGGAAGVAAAYCASYVLQAVLAVGYLRTVIGGRRSGAHGERTDGA